MGRSLGAFCIGLLGLGSAWANDLPTDADQPARMPALHEQLAHQVPSAGPSAGPEDRLIFHRQSSADAFVTGSFADSATIAGVPASALPEVEAALGHAIDLDRDLRTGDRFYVRWEQDYALDDHSSAGQPIGKGRVLAVELRTKRKGTIAMTRFRPLKAGPDEAISFYFANGTEAAAAPVSLPLERIQITSGYGLRPDPLDQPERVPPVAAPPAAEAAAPPAPPERKPEDKREIMRAYAGFYDGQLGRARDAGGNSAAFAEVDRIMAERRVQAREEQARLEAEKQAAEKAAAEKAAAPPPPPPQPTKPTLLYMHEGLDLLANLGTPVRAAADGVVTMARPDRGYGNAIHVDHARKMVTIYAHLSRFAPGIEPGAKVTRGEVIGFVGSTGRSTGAHLHFEVLVGGRPLDPMIMTRSAQLAGFDLARFKKQVAREQQDRVRQAALLP